MRYELRLTAYDMLDQVHVAATIYKSADGDGEPSRPVLHWSQTDRGTGQSDPVQWTRDTLLGLLEIL